MVRIYTNSSGLVQAHTSPGCIFRSMPWGHKHTPHKGWLIHFVRLMLDVIVTVDAVYDKPLDVLEATTHLYKSKQIFTDHMPSPSHAFENSSNFQMLCHSNCHKMMMTFLLTWFPRIIAATGANSKWLHVGVTLIHPVEPEDLETTKCHLNEVDIGNGKVPFWVGNIHLQVVYFPLLCWFTGV